MVTVSYEQGSTSGLPITDEVNAAAARRNCFSRHARLMELRAAIQQGAYRIPAGDLADALLRTARSAN